MICSRHPGGTFIVQQQPIPTHPRLFLQVAATGVGDGLSLAESVSQTDINRTVLLRTQQLGTPE